MILAWMPSINKNAIKSSRRTRGGRLYLGSVQAAKPRNISESGYTKVEIISHRFWITPKYWVITVSLLLLSSYVIRSLWAT